MSTITGTIYRIEETKTFGEKGFKKRETIVKTNDQYPQHLKVEFTQDKCDLLDNYKVGQEVTISINLNGRLWTNPKGEEVCFNTIGGWRIENATATPETQSFETTESVSSEDPTDLPFN